MSKITLCDVLSAFSSNSPSEVLPCAGLDLKLAVSRAKVGGYLKYKDGGLVLTERGQLACAPKRRRRRKKK